MLFGSGTRRRDNLAPTHNLAANELIEFGRTRTHGENAEIALSVCDYAYLMKRGSIVMEGTVEALRADPSVLEAYLA